ncbi:MFS transporter [Kitasatospora sp. GAS204B]|uniref:MFS transporter n=1 Tax=unclassified Kitasatospora TaxID=2633591 RepID=UPI002474B8A7|nr:MFS transporter [Kitasatospora sp. GAS204B]MDH6119936.1 MFS family permease [Kitasatospora sp. GAS204B]
MTTVGSAIPAARLPAALRHPVFAATLLAAVLHLIWAVALANDAGDLAAQYAWTEFTRQHPDAAYNLSWYGGMHTASYSVLSPYLMGLLGVRTTGMLVGTASAALAATLLTRSGLRRPLAPALWTAFALWCDVASGRVTFAIGVAFGLAATVLAVDRGGPRRLRGTWLFALAALATMGSPVVGLFLEVLAAALFLTGRRRESCPLAAAPVLVVAGTSVLFPFYGVQPFDWWAAAPVVAAALAVALLVPGDWLAVRRGALVYSAGVVLVWLIPSPVGSNVERLSLLFAGTVLLAVLLNVRLARRRSLLVGVAFISVAAWLAGRTLGDLLVTVPVARAASDGKALINELHTVGADRTRVEVVPLASHWEASGVAPYVDLARGWNRQTDVTRNPLFYADKLAPSDYHAWLQRWGVGYVALSSDKPDDAAKEEAALVAAGQPWLDPIWQHGSWRLYQVTDATPLAAPPAVVQQAGPAALTVQVPSAGSVHLLLPWSPWLGIAGDQGDANGCLAQQGEWTVLYAPAPGTYRITGKYSFDRGNPCPSGLAKAR